MDLVIYTDGASRGNPGRASYGYVIKTKSGVILHQEGKFLGIQTNNYAEYSAVLGAFKYTSTYFAKKAPHKILLLADSLLVVMQLNGKFRVKNPFLKALFDDVRVLEFKLGKVTYKHIPRAENYLADRLANQALDLSS